MRFFVFFIFYLLIAPAFATVQPIEFDANSTFVGKKALVIASRKTLQEVDQLIKTYNNSPMWRNSKPNWQIFLSSNDWYAISLGVASNVDCDRNKVFLINNNLIPKDSYCSSGKKFVKHISHNGSNFYSKAETVPNKTEVDNTEINTNSIASYSDQEICNKITFIFSGQKKLTTNTPNLQPFFDAAANRKLDCLELTLEEKVKIEAEDRKKIAEKEAKRIDEEFSRLYESLEKYDEKIKKLENMITILTNKIDNIYKIKGNETYSKSSDEVSSNSQNKSNKIKGLIQIECSIYEYISSEKNEYAHVLQPVVNEKTLKEHFDLESGIENYVGQFVTRIPLVAEIKTKTGLIKKTGYLIAMYDKETQGVLVENYSFPVPTLNIYWNFKDEEELMHAREYSVYSCSLIP